MEEPRHRITGRRSTLRYSGYDYHQAGHYFVTICCTHARQPLFGSIVDGQMRLSHAGRTAETCWLELDDPGSGVLLDTSVIMPDHLHGIVMLGTNPDVDCLIGLPDLIRAFKNRVQAIYRHRVADGTLPPYAGRLWQRHYYDRIIRSDRELEAIREYIRGNAGRWQERNQL